MNLSRSDYEMIERLDPDEIKSLLQSNQFLNDDRKQVMNLYYNKRMDKILHDLGFCLTIDKLFITMPPGLNYNGQDKKRRNSSRGP